MTREVVAADLQVGRHPDAFQVALDAGQSVTALHYAAGAPALDATVIIAHGAGAGQHHPFMTAFARALSTFGFDAVTFNFPYTEQKRRLPDRAPVLEACYAAVIRETRARIPSAQRWLFIGGKSMGGRMATPTRGVGSRTARLRASCCWGIRSIRPAIPRSGATRICRPCADRCSLCRAAATRSARPTNCVPSSSRSAPGHAARHRRRRSLVQGRAGRRRTVRPRLTMTCGVLRRGG